MKKGIIFVGGEYSVPKDKDIFENSIIVCADSGYDNALKTGVKVDAIIGDMDSVKHSLPDEVEQIKLNCEKDDTDTQACIDYLAEKGCVDIYLICGMGGRIDHSLANLMLLIYGKNKGVNVILLTENSEVFAIDSYREINGEKGDILSLIPLLGDAEGVTLTGLKYLLKRSTLKAGETIGISNEFVESTATVLVEKGFIAAIKTKEVK